MKCVASVEKWSNYTAFGSPMPGRKFTSSSTYRYGFNGKENDDETGTQDYGLRIYNPALGRFLSTDPKTADYPFYTPYQFAGNEPIAAIDLDGAEPAYPKPEGGYVTARDGALQKPLSLQGQEYFSSKGFGGKGSGAAESMGLDFVPGVGTVKGWGEAITGKDAITGEAIPTWVRVASILPYGKFLGKLKFLKHADEVIEQTSKHADNVANETRKVVEKSEQLVINKSAGKAKEGIVKQQLETELKEGEELLEQASFKLSNGKRAKPDFTVVNKEDKSIVKIVDSKAGNAKLSKNQKELQKTGGTLTGGKAGDYSGSSTGPTKIETR